MSLELRPINALNRFDLYEGEEQIGRISYCEPEDLGPRWTVDMWSLMGTGKEWYADTATSNEEAAQHAHELYEEFCAERRELNGSGPGPRT